MCAAIHDLIAAIWPLVPVLTIVLRFISAAIGLGLVIGTAIHRVRHGRRNRQR